MAPNNKISGGGVKFLVNICPEEAAAGHIDYIIIDCSPNLGLLTINALTASDYYICPVLPHHLSISGFSTLIQVVDKVQKRLNPGLELAGIVMTQFNRHKVLHRDTAEVIKSHFGNKLFTSTIPENYKIFILILFYFAYSILHSGSSAYSTLGLGC